MSAIAIVGGGPSGSATALQLLRAGVGADQIVIFDQATFPRPKLCGGALTTRGTELLEDLLGEHPVGGCDTRELEFRCALGAFPIVERGQQWLYDRGVLDNRLLDECKRLGVEVREAHRLTGIVADGESWSLTFQHNRQSHTETFPWVVGADGARGAVRRSLELRGGVVGRLVESVYVQRPSRPGTGRPGTGAPEFDPGRLYFDFDPLLDDIPGYAWIFTYPKPGSEPGAFWKIGIMDGRGVTDGKTLRAWTDAYADRNGFDRVDAKIAGWPEHYYDPKTEAHRPGLVLVGEAWGIDPLLGEGIAPSLETAMYAAPRIAEALAAGRRTIPDFERGFLKSEAGRNLRFQYRLAKLLYTGKSRRWLRVLFGHEYMRELAGAGTEAYGRLEHQMMRLARAYVWQSLKRGFPSNAPIPRGLPEPAAPAP